MRTIRKRLLALLLTAAMLGTLFAGLPIASAASGGARKCDSRSRWKYASTDD